MHGNTYLDKEILLVKTLYSNICIKKKILSSNGEINKIPTIIVGVLHCTQQT